MIKIKSIMTQTPLLAHYDARKETRVSADASKYGLGAVLLQKTEKDNAWNPIFYASRSLTTTEARYAQIEKEALAATWACEKFAGFLIGLHMFIIETDHKPLLVLLQNKELDELTPRLQRFRMRLMRFSYKIDLFIVPTELLNRFLEAVRVLFKSDFAYNHNGFGYKTKCYILNPAPHTWDEATQLCQERGGELASIPNKEVSQFISSELMTRHKTSWIGLSKNISNQFTWTNKEKVQYLPWQAPFDGRNTDNCVQLNTAGASGVFEPIQCEFELSSVCEIPRVLESPGMDEDTGLTVPLYDCPASWRQKDEFCYKLIPEQMSWQDAQDHCGEMNGDLTSIHNQDTQDFLKTLACDCSRPNPVWIGLHQNGRRENFEWSDGSPFDYFNWRDGLRSFNPYSETQKRCVQFECSRGCEWNDIPCDSKLQFVCQVWRAYPLDMETTRAGELFTTTDAEPATTAAATTKVDEPETTITSTTLVEEPETTTAAAKITTTPAEEPETTTAAATITTTPAEEPETTAAATVAVTTPADEPETTTTTPADEPVTTTTPADEPETTRTTQTTTVDETETTTAVDATTRDPEFHSTVVTDSTTEIPDIDTTAKLPNVVIDRTDRYPASDSNIIIAARDDTDSQQYGVQTANKEDKTGDSDNQGLLSIELLIGIFCAVVVAIFLLSVVLVFVSRHFKGPLIQNKNSVRYVNHKDENEYVDIMGPQSGGSEPTPDATPVMSQTSLEVEMYNNYVPSARDLDAGASLSFENSVYDMTR
ncbi:Pol polyprotein [Plakobranchus ocellatus]|uniref:Pol polyprotein n=1 Tax=Plakobranchus ocellatus TaxID=259542 RepID=A0AAV3YVE8_9GAST|nr:Pol polyprotein [Plakobranchus ocellatus]